LSACENIKDINKLVISKRWSISLEQSEEYFTIMPKKKEEKIGNLIEKNEVIEDDNKIIEITDKKFEEIKNIQEEGHNNAMSVNFQGNSFVRANSSQIQILWFGLIFTV